MKYNSENMKINLFYKIFNSITNLKSYTNFLKETLGKAILYLFLISLIFGILGSMRGVINSNLEITDFKNVYNQKLRNFQIKDGEFKIDKKMPIIISNRSNDYYLIDTSGKTVQSALNKYDRGILILKDKLIEKIDKYNIQVIYFNSFGSNIINQDTINEYLPLLRMIPPFITLGIIIGYFIGGLLIALIVSIFVQIFYRRINIDFESLYKISIYSLTAPLFLDTVLSVFKIDIPYWTFLYAIITLIYVVIALKYAEKNNQLAG
ncbi:DUF1189 domain-containing protein [Clostridium akagii]|uniref:DUF1189 domain-containing protein n=1 Tax=Clostridium akagii TaxID=91623 RepID=UPI00047E4919|nr:DUF1189 domain-containing protein [Clostridium akagii]